MTTDLEQRLRDALHEDAERARLVNPDGPPVAEPRLLTVDQVADDQRLRRSPRKLVAVAAAVVVVAAATVAVIENRDDDHDMDTGPLVIADLQPGSTVELPPGPLSPRDTPAMVWSGSEMIVWGGFGTSGPLDDGAAFDPTTGEWRVVADAPIGARSLPQVAWTGSEMLVVGGYNEFVVSEEPVRDGAAYNPSTDSWRQLPDAPIAVGDGAEAVWTGDELIVVGGITAATAAAYSPDTNEWRRLADPPDLFPGSLVWAGEAALMTTPDPNGTTGASPLVRYDPSADEWQTVDDKSYAYLVAVPDGDGEVRSVVALPTELGEPVTVLDRTGRITGTLPGHPGDPEIYGTVIEPELGHPYADDGTWIGDEALFWIQGSDSPYGSLQRPAPWALDPQTAIWRELGESAPPLGVHLELIGDTGVLIGWGPPTTEDGALSTGISYRPPDPRATVQPLESPLGLPEPGEQPADAAAAEEEIRETFLAIFDTDIPAEERAPLNELPAVWLASANAVAAGPTWELVQSIEEEVHDVVFVSPTHAVVRFEFFSPNGAVPADHIGDALLVDGRWVMAATTSCGLFDLTGDSCDMSLED
jgi:Kelch motif